MSRVPCFASATLEAEGVKPQACVISAFSAGLSASEFANHQPGPDSSFESEMARGSRIAVRSLLVLLLLVRAVLGDVSNGASDRAEEWGYIDVRPGAHLFWWLYHSPGKEGSAASVPLLLWLQGGPGASGIGYGDFSEIGPLDTRLQPNPHTWLKKAHLLFVDNPVGTGFSYVDDTALLTTTNAQVTADLMCLLTEFYKKHPALAANPLYVFSESYGGKFATELGLALHNATRSGELHVNFAGVALGDAWISPLDSVVSWGPFLQSMSRVDYEAAASIKSATDNLVHLVEAQRWLDAERAWRALEAVVLQVSNGVNFYNILAPDLANASPQGGQQAFVGQTGTGTTAAPAPAPYLRNRALQFQTHDSDVDGLLEELMNGPIRQKLGIVPANWTWVTSSDVVFAALAGDFMQDTIAQVTALLEFGVNVTVYNGQLDLICATPGTEAWVQKLKWRGLAHFNAARRKPLYFGEQSTVGFVKQYRNLAFYWILNAGHLLPADQPRAALEMLGMVTRT